MRSLSLHAIVLTASTLVMGMLCACGDSGPEPGAASSAAATATGSARSDEAHAGPSAMQPDYSHEEMARVMGGAASSDMPVEMRAFAVSQLGTLDPEVALAQIVQALSDREPVVVLAAIEALPQTDDEAALEALAELASHSDPRVESAARSKLASLR